MLFLYIILVLFSLICKRSKFLFYTDLILLLLLFACNIDNADRGVYEMRFYRYDDEMRVRMTEPLFTFIMYVFNYLELELQSFIIFVAATFVLVIGLLIKKVTTFGCFVLAFYMLTEFFFDVVQLRNTLALIFYYPGLYILFMEPKTSKAICIYIICVIFSALIHFSSLFFLLFIFVRVCSIKKCLLITVCFIFISVVFVNLLSNYMEMFLFSEKIEQVQEGSEMQSTATILFQRLRILFFETIPFMVIYLYRKKRLKEDRFIVGIFKICILLWCVSPMLFISMEFHRIFFTQVILLMMGYARMMEKKRIKASVIYIFAFVSIKKSILEFICI